MRLGRRRLELDDVLLGAFFIGAHFLTLLNQIVALALERLFLTAQLAQALGVAAARVV